MLQKKEHHYNTKRGCLVWVISMFYPGATLIEFHGRVSTKYRHFLTQDCIWQDLARRDELGNTSARKIYDSCLSRIAIARNYHDFFLARISMARNLARSLYIVAINFKTWHDFIYFYVSPGTSMVHYLTIFSGQSNSGWLQQWTIISHQQIPAEAKLPFLPRQGLAERKKVAPVPPS